MVLSTQEVTPLGVFTNDVFSEQFIKHRRIYITGTITSELSADVCASLNYLDSKGNDEIQMVFIDSPGGSVSAGMAIIDTMNACHCDIRTVALGQTASMAAVISSCGTKGKRMIGENARMMIHQALGGASGQTTDILREAENIRNVNDRVFSILSRNTGKAISEISVDCDRDYYLDCHQAIEYGLADHMFEGWDS
ncbi:MAG: ATP-dependent Clp protease proteolytic subunit [Solobacterium sp.]|nr:ATP-dependent Clp protease proteolytic subunit [Solobacterium sp.]